MKSFENYSQINVAVPRYSKPLPEKFDAPQIESDFRQFQERHLQVTPKRFVINPEKGTRFRIKSLSKYTQDVIVTCHSFLFEIKKARRQIGVTSQWFHVFGKDQEKEFEIGMKGDEVGRGDREMGFLIAFTVPELQGLEVVKPKNTLFPDNSFENLDHCEIPFAAGFLEITHYKSRIAGSSSRPKRFDTDREWGIEGTKLLIRTASHSWHYHGYYMDRLEAETETDGIRKRKIRFAKHFYKKAVEEERKKIEKSHGGLQMMVR
uniref:Movement protein n=1 Tax=Caenorhabditis tropicalis TaxID=1561998 RepID=A0A1I7V1D8_9PELO